MRTAQIYAISEDDMLETTILTSTNTTGTLTRDDLDQLGTTYSTYPVMVYKGQMLGMAFETAMVKTAVVWPVVIVPLIGITLVIEDPSQVDGRC